MGAHPFTIVVEVAEEELVAGAGFDRALVAFFGAGGALRQGRRIGIDRGGEKEVFAVGGPEIVLDIDRQRGDGTRLTAVEGQAVELV